MNMNGNMEGMIMKMKKFFLLAAAVAAAISCVKESLPAENENPAPEAELVPMTFTATADNGEAETKVFYDGQTKTTQWKSGDKIAVISSNGTASTFEAVEVQYVGVVLNSTGNLLRSFACKCIQG